MDISQRFRQDTAKPVLATSSLPYPLSWSTHLPTIMAELERILPAEFTYDLQKQCKQWGTLHSCHPDATIETVAFLICQLTKKFPSRMYAVTLTPPLRAKYYTARIWTRKGV